MRPGLRRLALTAHITLSVGWLGAVVAYLSLALSGFLGQDAGTARAAYVTMEVIGWSALVPLSLAALLSGLVQSLGTEWGLFRHYWVVTKLVLTLAATGVLLAHMRAVSDMAALAATTPVSGAELGPLRLQLVIHAVGGLLVLLAATALSVFKPWGRTPYGVRRQEERRKGSQWSRAAAAEGGAAPAAPRVPGGKRPAAARGAGPGTAWRRYVLFGVGGLVLLWLVLHLAGGGMRVH